MKAPDDLCDAKFIRQKAGLAEGWLQLLEGTVSPLWLHLLVPMLSFGFFPNDSLSRLCVLLCCVTGIRPSPSEAGDPFMFMSRTSIVSVSLDCDRHMCPTVCTYYVQVNWQALLRWTCGRSIENWEGNLGSQAVHACIFLSTSEQFSCCVALPAPCTPLDAKNNRPV